MPRCHSLLPHADEGAGAFLVVSDRGAERRPVFIGSIQPTAAMMSPAGGGQSEFLRGRRRRGSALRDDWQGRGSSPNGTACMV